jgi:Zn finger protein HypA/HybF involved in hydrogenase expression
VSARLRCDACAEDWALQAADFRCPFCGRAEVKVASGDELEVESIDVEEREGACTA